MIISDVEMARAMVRVLDEEIDRLQLLLRGWHVEHHVVPLEKCANHLCQAWQEMPVHETPVEPPVSPQEPRNDTDVTQGPSEEIEALRAALLAFLDGDTSDDGVISCGYCDERFATGKHHPECPVGMARAALLKPDSEAKEGL